MQDQPASIQSDGFDTEVEILSYAGLAQGSPLSPNLFAFFNADLVDQPVDIQGDASANMDDYFRWRVVGMSADIGKRNVIFGSSCRTRRWMRSFG